MRTAFTLLLAAGLLVPAALGADDKKDKDDGFVPLFNGKNIDGWERHSGTATYRVEGDAIVGKTAEGSPNTFLCTKKEYGDFELKFEVKVDDALNSGVQIRSKVRPKGDRVHGPQVEIATNGSAGFIYGEALGTGWLAPPNKGTDKARKAFKKGQWNQYRVRAEGKSIKTWVNGVPVADYTDNKTGMMKGHICLQVHGIKKGAGPYEVRWRNIVIKELQKK